MNLVDKASKNCKIHILNFQNVLKPNLNFITFFAYHVHNLLCEVDKQLHFTLIHIEICDSQSSICQILMNKI